MRESTRKNATKLVLTIVILYAVTAFGQLTVAVADGFAEGTTGGKGGTTVTVNSGASFISACATGSPKIIVVEGDLGSIGQVRCTSDKTIIGKDTASGFTGNLTFSGAENVIVQNLTIRNPGGIGTGDGMEASACSNIFVTRCTFIDCKDGSFDIKNGSDFLTVSWCRFLYPTITGHNLPNLLGHSDNNASIDRGKLHVTMHHNWYDAGCDQRMPRVRFGTVHVYNNFYGCENNTYCIGTGFECKIRVESCTFENVNQPWSDINGMANGGEIGWNNLLLTDTELPAYAPNKWPVFTPSYDFTMDSTGMLKDLLTDSVYGAGNRLPGRRVAATQHHPRPMQSGAGDKQASGSTRTRTIALFDFSGRHVTDVSAQGGKSDAPLPAGVYFTKMQGADKAVKFLQRYRK